MSPMYALSQSERAWSLRFVPWTNAQSSAPGESIQGEGDACEVATASGALAQSTLQDSTGWSPSGRRVLIVLIRWCLERTMCISQSVGTNAANNQRDVRTVQFLLNFNMNRLAPLALLKTDGGIGP